MIVAIEGIDGVGKTTIAGLLRSWITGSEVLHTPPRTYYEGNYEVLRDLQCISRAALFVAGALAVNERLTQQPATRMRIIDRFSGSVTGMNRFLTPILGDACRRLSLVTPDITILLVCTEAERHRRLSRRGKDLDPFEVELSKSVALRRAMHAAVTESAIDLVTIDNTDLSPVETAKLCLYHIQRRLPAGVEDTTMLGPAVEHLETRLLSKPLPQEFVTSLFLGNCTHPENSPRLQVATRPDTAREAHGTASSTITPQSLLDRVKEALGANKGDSPEDPSMNSGLATAVTDLTLAASGEKVDSERLNLAFTQVQAALTRSSHEQIIQELSHWLATQV